MIALLRIALSAALTSGCLGAAERAPEGSPDGCYWNAAGQTEPECEPTKPVATPLECVTLHEPARTLGLTCEAVEGALGTFTCREVPL